MHLYFGGDETKFLDNWMVAENSTFFSDIMFNKIKQGMRFFFHAH